ncbi:polynucleotide adenylyltransferase PcnB [Rivihabitans pingtungensis]|uniref:polynucleotide adenylyltransferase PcnB n=1 Tax=Rivihabitans pingtungensis TaxID=1054498 RepID=UPI002BFD9A71|nr:polynucleotide adenylyltransferase PcnB [Rivihabitans pingtungensis]HNX71102.1 polynucleotide adenylyltransferase PcnB [Rivihabitans pingtungensis]
MIRKLLSRVFKLPERRPKPKVFPFTQHGVRRESISPAALKITSRLQEAGFAAFVVGGAVRDLLLGQHPKDFDVATNATPEQVHHLFRRSRIIGRRFRIVHVMVGAETIEVTTFRGGDDSVTDSEGRILNDNVFGSQEEDARRRDFTVNALFYNPSDETIVDYHHGVRDVHARKLAMIGNPVQRYREDPVRMLRAVRLAAKLELRIDEPTRKPIAELASLLQNVPAARLFDEMLKMLFSGQAYQCVRMLRQEGLHQGIFPLLDVIAEESAGADFIRLALENTDRRIREDKPVSVGFLLATLLWGQVQREWTRRMDFGDKPIPALFDAMAAAERIQDDQLAIPRRFATTMREIWALQPRFDNRDGSRPYRLLEQPRFRAGYDFLALRAAVGEVPQALVDWWTAFQEGDEAQRQALIAAARHSGEARTGAKKRRRRKKKPNGQGQPMDDGE